MKGRWLSWLAALALLPALPDGAGAAEDDAPSVAPRNDDEGAAPTPRRRRRKRAAPPSDGPRESEGAYSIIARGDDAVLLGPGARGASTAGAATLVDTPPTPLQTVDPRLVEVEQKEQAARRELEAVGPALAANQAKSLREGRVYYRLTRAGLLPLAGGFTELVRHALRVEHTRRALHHTLAERRALEAKGDELRERIARLGRDRAALAAQREVALAAPPPADDTRRREAFARAFQGGSPPGGEYVAVYGAGRAADDAPPAGFAAAKGRLLFPVVGRAEARAASREGAGGPGLEIRAPAGSPVRAVFAGRVAFADRYGAYGRIVILDHGDHHYTVSGNLGDVSVKVGDELSAGERIGTVGDEGAGAMLYFEVRRGTSTLAPGPWLGL